MNLADKQCEACSIDALLTNDDQQQTLKQEIPNWAIITVSDVQRLVRQYQFDDYLSAVAFTQKVAEIAEAEGHHPAILLEWGKVEVSWWSHKIKGLHENDFIMAAKTDALQII